MSKTSPEKSTAELIARLEAANAGSRELDAQIICTVRGWTHYERAYGYGKLALMMKFVDRGWHMVPHYTTSLDAALTLVPEGWRWGVSHSARGHKWHASAWPKSKVILTAADGSSGHTPALALCTAALQAQGTVTHSPPAAPDSGARQT